MHIHLLIRLIDVVLEVHSCMWEFLCCLWEFIRLVAWFGGTRKFLLPNQRHDQGSRHFTRPPDTTEL